MNIGARIIKTGLAVTLAITICKALGIQPASFAAITAVVNMQPSVSKSLKNAWEQISVHVIGVVLAAIMGFALGTGPLVMGLAVIIVIVICNRIGWTGAISLGIVSVIFILDSPPEQFLSHAGIRSLAVFVGLAVAISVNRLLAPPHYREKFFAEVESLFEDTSQYFLTSFHSFINATFVEKFELKEPEELKAKLELTSGLLEHARDELRDVDNPAFVERLLEVCRGFVERGDSINQMTRQRVKRRNSPGSPLMGEPVSLEFQAVLDVLSLGETKLTGLVHKLEAGLKEKRDFGQFSEDIEYWVKFDKVLDDWHRTVNGVFYLRALMEVAVVGTEIRWAARRLKTLLNMHSKGLGKVAAKSKTGSFN